MSHTPPPPVDTRVRNRNRIALLAVVAVFVLPILIAMWIARADRIPDATGVHGEMYDPAHDLRGITLERVDGSDYAWDPEARFWRILVVAPAQCEAECVDLLADLDKIWRLFGRHAERVHVLWACDQDACMPPAGATLPGTFIRVRPDADLRAALPGVGDPDGTPVYVLDPNGFLVLRYAPGFDPSGLRRDLGKLVRLV